MDTTEGAHPLKSVSCGINSKSQWAVNEDASTVKTIIAWKHMICIIHKSEYILAGVHEGDFSRCQTRVAITLYLH